MPEFQPSDAQLEILQILWDIEPATVREVHEILSKQKQVGLTTVQKQMQRMTEKNLIEAVSQEGKSFRFQATVKEGQMRKSLLKRFKENVYKGSAMDLVMHALGDSKPSEEEIDQLLEWLKQHKSENQS